MQKTILDCETVRLVPFSVADVEQVQALHADPYGNRCSGDVRECAFADAVELVQSSLRNQEELGLAKWKAVSPVGRFLGWAGFTPVDETSEISLNYCFSAETVKDDDALPKTVCSELIKWFFNKTYYSHLVAVVRTDNRDMRDVMLDTGFTHRESKVISNMQADVFQLFSPSMQSYLMTA